MELAIFLTLFIALDLLALRFGADSRDDRAEYPR
jgi:hypothetical protein